MPLLPCDLCGGGQTVSKQKLCVWTSLAHVVVVIHWNWTTKTWHPPTNLNYPSKHPPWPTTKNHPTSLPWHFRPRLFPTLHAKHSLQNHAHRRTRLSMLGTLPQQSNLVPCSHCWLGCHRNSSAPSPATKLEKVEQKLNTMSKMSKMSKKCQSHQRYTQQYTHTVETVGKYCNYQIFTWLRRNMSCQPSSLTILSKSTSVTSMWNRLSASFLSSPPPPGVFLCTSNSLDLMEL